MYFAGLEVLEDCVGKELKAVRLTDQGVSILMSDERELLFSATEFITSNPVELQFRFLPKLPIPSRAEMLDALLWEEDRYDSDWGNEDPDGITEGWCYFYGCRGDGNIPYPIVRRSDRMIAWPPKNNDNPYSATEWWAKYRADRKPAKSFSWLKDRVLIWDQELDTREVDGSCSSCGAQ